MQISIEKAAQLITNGQVVAVPTETVYGLAASLNNPSAIAKIFSIKGRPSNNPLIVHLAGINELSPYVLKLAPMALELAAGFWPGPLTLILPARLDLVPDVARAGLNTVAFRVPNHPIALELLKLTGPLVMPSANLSGKPSATSVHHVEDDFGANFPVLDGGSCKSGVESTILYLKEQGSEGEWVIVRLGALSPEEFNPILGYCPRVAIGEKEQAGHPICPGQLYRHYSPQAQLILAEQLPSEADVVIGFEDRNYPLAKRIFLLGSSLNPSESTHSLYAVLRRLDQEGIYKAWVDVDFPDTGLWLTLRERLLKASSS